MGCYLDFPIYLLFTETFLVRHTYMIMAEAFTLALYIGSMIVLPEYFGELLSNISGSGLNLMKLV